MFTLRFLFAHSFFPLVPPFFESPTSSSSASPLKTPTFLHPLLTAHSHAVGRSGPALSCPGRRSVRGLSSVCSGRRPGPGSPGPRSGVCRVAPENTRAFDDRCGMEFWSRKVRSSRWRRAGPAAGVAVLSTGRSGVGRSGTFGLVRGGFGFNWGVEDNWFEEGIAGFVCWQIYVCFCSVWLFSDT